VLFSTHVMQHAERLCRKVVLIAEGRKVFEGSVSAARDEAPRALEIEGRISAEDAASLPGVSGVESVAVEGDEAGVFAHRAALTKTADPQAALKAAFSRGLDVRRFEMKQPSLHDAFIVLTGGDR
jgi:ABC-2 type transport system ATP-binding protein